jgi:phosphatidate cytidylyltransferase
MKGKKNRNEPASKGKSLSNNATRVIVAVFAIPVILAAAYFGGIYFFIFTLFVSLAAYHEFVLLARNKGANANLWFGFIAIIFLLLNNFRVFTDFYSIILFIVFTITLVELFRNKGSAILNIGASLLGIFYIGLFSSALLAVREFYPRIDEMYLRGGYLIISIFASIWICDSAAYYGGTALGKHKLFPRVSPNKSWEGAIFGFIFAIITLVLAKIIVLNFLSWSTAITIGIVVGIFGQIGDLIESLFKRDADVKDSSSIIPGHGGIFDRFDSLLYTAPVILLILKYFGR